MIAAEEAGLTKPPEERNIVSLLADSSTRREFEFKNKLHPQSAREAERRFSREVELSPLTYEMSTTTRAIMMEVNNTKRELKSSNKLDNASMDLLGGNPPLQKDFDSTKKGSHRNSEVEVEKTALPDLGAKSTQNNANNKKQKKKKVEKSKAMASALNEKEADPEKDNLKEVKPEASPQKIQGPSGRLKLDRKLQKQESEELKEEVQNRIDKLKNSKDSNKKLVIVKFVLIAIMISGLYTLSLLWMYLISISFRSMLDVVFNIGSMAAQIKMVYLLFTEDLARRTLLTNSAGRSLYAEAHELGYYLGNQITSNIKNFPSGYSNFETYFKKLQLESVCSNFLQPTKGISKLSFIRLL